MDTINKYEISELRSFKNPPSGVRLVGEAIALIFNKRAEYDQFLKLLNSGPDQFIRSIKEYNINFISTFTLNELRTYIDNPVFTQNNMVKFSKPASLFCSWVISAYNYGKFVNEVIIIKKIAFLI